MNRPRSSVLIVGSGAREHAMAWKLRLSPHVDTLFVAPGNAGTASIAENLPIAATDLDRIVRFTQERDIALTVVGPEAPLALGLADRLRASGRKVVGPGMSAAQIESSKAFAKDLMRRAGVPTADYQIFDDAAAALRHLAHAAYPIVIKADGLAAGKGVSVCADRTEAESAVRAMMLDRTFGAAGDRVIVEEALRGPEISLLALVDGARALALPLAQDHKRLGDGDAGPNTGGMGAYAPVPFLTAAERNRLVQLVIDPVVAALAAGGMPYRGVIFAGLMLTENGPRVLEYNCRFGDPEAQVILPLLADDLYPYLEAVAAGSLPDRMPISDLKAVGVVLAAPGYPEKPIIGRAIEGLQAAPPDTLIFHAGTRLQEGHARTAGGRVLTVVGTGTTIDEAAERAYAAPIYFEGMQRRSDIAWQARTLTTRPERRKQSAQPTEMATEGATGSVGHCARRVQEAIDVAPAFRPSDAPHSTLSSTDCEQNQDHHAQRSGRAGRIAVLASGEGSNLQALIDAGAAGLLQADIAAMISYNPQARALQRARNAGIPAFTTSLLNRRDPAARRTLEHDLLDILVPLQVDLIVLAGWMLILSAQFLDRCPCPLLNVHPALLPGPDISLPPGFPILRGAHAVRDALTCELPYTGVSVHYVTPDVDAGPVVLQEVVPILPGDDEISLYCRIKEVEHRLLPRAVQNVLLTHQVHGGVYA